MSDASKKLVADQKEWSVVAKELEGENLKLASYDNTLMSAIGDIKDKKVLDYGAGPGILALGLQKMGADVKFGKINNERQKNSGNKKGLKNIYKTLKMCPKTFL